MPGAISRTSRGDLPERKGVYLLTLPRSASNLFQRMMAQQPGYQNSSYKLFDAALPAIMGLDKGPLSKWRVDEREALYAASRASWEALQDEIEDARNNGKQAFIKEHAPFLWAPDRWYATVYDGDEVEPLIYRQRDGSESVHTNPSSLPDSFLLSMQPIFQIRHPALMFPSLLRARMHQMPKGVYTKCPSMSSMLTLKYSRELYDWYLEHGSERKPRVIDADDIMNNPAAVRQLCIETGFDPDAVQYEWEEQHEEDPMKARFLSTINGSTGIIQGLDARNLSIEVEKSKWKAEFGDEVAEDMVRFVNNAMPDYEYLLSQRSRLKASV